MRLATVWLHISFGEVIALSAILIALLYYVLVKKRKIENRVRDSERIAAIVSHSQDAILSKSLTGKILTWNQAAEKMFQYTANEMVGQSVFKLVPPDRYAEEQSVLERVAAGIEVAPFETIRLRKNGSELHVSASISYLRDWTGRVIGFSSIFRDIAEQRTLDEKLNIMTDELKESNRQLVKMNRSKD